MEDSQGVNRVVVGDSQHFGGVLRGSPSIVIIHPVCPLLPRETPLLLFWRVHTVSAGRDTTMASQTAQMDSNSTSASSSNVPAQPDPVLDLLNPLLSTPNEAGPSRWSSTQVRDVREKLQTAVKARKASRGGL